MVCFFSRLARCAARCAAQNDQIGQGFALLCVSYPTADCSIQANAEDALS